MDNYYKEKATQKLNKIKSNLPLYITCGFDDYINIVSNKDTKEMKEDELDKYINKKEKCVESFRKLKSQIENLKDVNELKNICSNEVIKNNFYEYSKYLSKKIFKTENEYRKVSENFVLPLKILDIELNEENSRIIYNINYDDTIFPENNQRYEDCFYLQFLEKKKEIEFTRKNNYYSEIKDIIEDKQFLKDFYEILKSKHIVIILFSFFLSSTKIFNENRNNLYKSDNAQFLRAQYEQLLKDIKNSDFQLFKTIFKIKSLAYKIPSLTGPSMKIFINPILDFSDIAKNDDIQRKNILKSALIILLIYEIFNLLKYYPIENKYPEEIQNDPKERENGQCLILHLFGKNIIKNINNEQASLVNDLKTWDNLEKLKDIFKEDNNIKNCKMGELDLCFTIKEKINQIKTDYCYWE